jgi:protein involved in polysaccharide export with SLBB domain
MNAEEKARLNSAISVLDSARDSVNVASINRSSTYSVGIDLEAALANPGCDKDLVLREGDRLIVPEYINTVKISGNVMYPNVVTYDSKMTVRDYVQQAGGYGYRSKRSKAYVVYLNGTVKRAKKLSTNVVEPGCEIVVPQKREKKSNLSEVLAISTTAASLGTMIATISNLLR